MGNAGTIASGNPSAKAIVRLDKREENRRPLDKGEPLVGFGARDGVIGPWQVGVLILVTVGRCSFAAGTSH